MILLCNPIRTQHSKTQWQPKVQKVIKTVFKVGIGPTIRILEKLAKIFTLGKSSFKYKVLHKNCDLGTDQSGRQVSPELFGYNMSRKWICTVESR